MKFRDYYRFECKPYRHSYRKIWFENHLAFIFYREEEYLSYKEGVKADYSEFYARIRKKEEARTSLANYEVHESAQTNCRIRKDILYIGDFRLRWAVHFQNVSNCMLGTRTKHPDQKLLCVGRPQRLHGRGFSYICPRACTKGSNNRKTLEWVENHKMNICQWFTVDDLFFLKRGFPGAAGSLLERSIFSYL